MSLEERIKSTIRDVKDFPKPGILFKDITPILLDHELVNDIVDDMYHNQLEQDIDAVTGIESRGFLFGVLLAQKFGVPFIPIRKLGKLPGETRAYSYDLEYGSATVEIHKGHVKKDMKVLVHDDLLATGGTAVAAAELIQQEGGTVAGFSFLVSLDFLNGKEKLLPYSENIDALVNY